MTTASRTGRAPAEPLLTTRLMPPPLRAALVSRPRLHQRLSQALNHSLTLIVAPAGSGKTTLLAGWLTEAQQATAGGRELPGAQPPAFAWLSLDAGDTDPARFWRYVLAALEQAAAGLTAEPTALLDGSRAGVQSALTALLNAMRSEQRRFMLALDDYHLIDDAGIHAGIAFLVERAPHNLHLVIAGRSHPPLPLERLRVRGRLLEFGAEDLRFSRPEAADLLAHSLGLTLGSDVLASLVERTEGWAAGLVLAALAAQGRDDPTAYAHSFGGASPLVLDYIAAEVLSGQPEPIRRFLLATAPLQRLCAALCDAVTGRDDSQALLEQVERAGLFLIPLDGERRWYRYHPLFAEVLRERLSRAEPAALRTVSLRAAAWCAACGLTDEAVGYALSAASWEEATRLVAEHGHAALVRGETATLRGWLDALPPAARRLEARLALLDGWLRVLAGDITMAAVLAAEAEAADPQGLVVAELRALRAIIAMMSGRLAEGLALAALPAEALPQEPFVRAVHAIARGLHAEFYGEVALAAAAFIEAARVSEAGGSFLVSFLAWCQLGETQLLQGRLRDAEASYRYADALRSRDAATARAVGATAQIGLGAVAFERGNYGQARALIEAALAGPLVLRDLAAIEAYSYLAQIEAAEGAFDAAIVHLENAEAVCRATGFAPLLPMVGASRAALDVRRGALTQAAGWLDAIEAERSTLPAGIRELVELGRARVLSALGRHDEALATLDEVAHKAAAAGRERAVIESLAARAAMLAARGKTAAARAAREAAEALAASQGFVALLEEAGAPQGPPSPYVAPPLTLRRSHDLTEREIEVLRLVADGHGNLAIAERLVVAPGTVKKHINRIFAKLDVTTRTQAIVRARALGIME